VLEDDVDAALGRERAHLGREVLLLVVDDVVGAERLRMLELGRAAGRRDDPRPKSLAICTAALPTPLPAACTSTSSPARRPQRATSMCQAVMKASGKAAPCTKSMPAGIAMTFAAGTAASSRQPPSVVSPNMP
jgi:hypothetical protein